GAVEELHAAIVLQQLDGCERHGPAAREAAGGVEHLRRLGPLGAGYGAEHQARAEGVGAERTAAVRHEGITLAQEGERAVGAVEPRKPRHSQLNGRRAGWFARATARRASEAEADTPPAGEILDELPCHAARDGAAGLAPLDGLGAEILVGNPDAVRVAIAADHCQVLVLAARMEAEPEAEAIRERDLLLGRLRGVDGGR